MKVFLITDYFYPFNPGGSEWSVYELAKALQESNIEIKIITLNYGAKEQEMYKGLEVIRLSFHNKLSERRRVVNPFWQNNPVFHVTSTVNMFRLVSNEKPDVLHVQGKFLVPAAVLVGKMRNIPVIVSIRDKQMLCPIGYCFFKSDRRKACTMFEFLTSDFPWFYKNYIVNKNPYTFLYSLLGNLWGRFSFYFIKFLANKARKVVAISTSQKDYLKANGFRDIEVIYNTADFKNRPKISKPENNILFVGKISKGKGVELLINAFSRLNSKARVRLLLAGASGTYPTEQILKEKYVKFLGEVEHHKMREFYKNSSVTVMPSLFPEAFGRVALESLSVGTPVVALNRGALPEIVQDKLTGRIVPAKVKSLRGAIADVLKNQQKYRINIIKNYSSLEKKFYLVPLKKHISLYTRLTK